MKCPYGWIMEEHGRWHLCKNECIEGKKPEEIWAEGTLYRKCLNIRRQKAYEEKHLNEQPQKKDLQLEIQFDW